VRSQALEEVVRRHLEDHVRNEEDHQASVVLQAGQLEVLLQAKDGSIRYVHSEQTSVQAFGSATGHVPVEERQKVHDTDARQHMPVDLSHQLVLIDGDDLSVRPTILLAVKG
jgi:hypothetical protein